MLVQMMGAEKCIEVGVYTVYICGYLNKYIHFYNFIGGKKNKLFFFNVEDCIF